MQRDSCYSYSSLEHIPTEDSLNIPEQSGPLKAEGSRPKAARLNTRKDARWKRVRMERKAKAERTSRRKLSFSVDVGTFLASRLGGKELRSRPLAK